MHDGCVGVPVGSPLETWEVVVREARGGHDSHHRLKRHGKGGTTRYAVDGPDDLEGRKGRWRGQQWIQIRFCGNSCFKGHPRQRFVRSDCTALSQEASGTSLWNRRVVQRRIEADVLLHLRLARCSKGQYQQETQYHLPYSGHHSTFNGRYALGTSRGRWSWVTMGRVSICCCCKTASRRTSDHTAASERTGQWNRCVRRHSRYIYFDVLTKLAGRTHTPLLLAPPNP